LELALESVNKRKQERLMMLAELYRADKEMLETTPIRIDVIGVAIQRNGLAQVEMVQDAINW
jgi:Holliday junction resolvase-like predicted endonuclease